MTEKETTKLQNNKSVKSSEVPIHQQQQVGKELITLQGFTTSRVEQALKADNPYPARVFLRLDCIDCHNTKQVCQALSPKHKKCEECAEQKCRECEVPVFFRIKENSQ